MCICMQSGCDQHSCALQIFRSKGFAWIARRDDMMAEWSSAGNILRLTCGGPWFAVLPPEAWPDVEVGLLFAFALSTNLVSMLCSYVSLLCSRVSMLCRCVSMLCSCVSCWLRQAVLIPAWAPGRQVTHCK